MKIQTIEFNGINYPMFQALGNAAQFATPYAQHVCKGRGVDVGCHKKEWAFPGAFTIDPAIDPTFDALTIPYDYNSLDYIFSSHCLEHLDNWVDVLNYWTSLLKINGVLFLYLPDYSQEYWRPWNNRKHKNIFTSQIIKDYMDQYYTNIFVSGVDLNNSFMIFGQKTDSYVNNRL